MTASGVEEVEGIIITIIIITETDIMKWEEEDMEEEGDGEVLEETEEVVDLEEVETEEVEMEVEEEKKKV